jgi:hypothetical protein
MSHQSSHYPSYMGIAIDLAVANLRAHIDYLYRADWPCGASSGLLLPSLRAQLRPAVAPELQAKPRARVRGLGPDQGVLGDAQASSSSE